MSAIDSYGEFEVPEEKSVIEVVEDPVKTVISCYEMFRELVKDLYDLNQVYENASLIFKERENLSLNTKQLIQLFDALKDESPLGGPCKGMFLSAMHNNTKLDNLVINTDISLDHIGYKLKKNKLLILGTKKPYIFSAGRYCEGNMINLSSVQNLCDFAKDGLQINKGRSVHTAKNAKGGMQINFLENGEVCEGEFFITNHEKIVINGEEFELKNISLHSKVLQSLYQKYFFPLRNKLYQKLEEINFLYQMQNDYEGLVKKVDSFDWKKFEKDIRDIADEMIKVLY